MAITSLNRARALGTLLLATALTLLAACTKDQQDSTPGAKRAVGAGIAGGRAVVADVSVGTNPYHEIFRRPDWTKQPCKSDPAIPCDLPQLNLTLGDDYAASLAADTATWAAYKPGTLYWVPGTNLLLLTLREAGSDICGDPCGIHDGYVDAGFVHGVATSGAMAGACPDCYVLVIQDAPNYDGSAIERVAKDLSWVDSVAQTALQGSGTNPFSAMDGTLLDKTVLMQPMQQATHDLSVSGRLFFAASGDYGVAGSANADLPALGYDYPPWVVAAGGMTDKNPFPGALNPECNAIDVLSGTPAEMLGEFAQNLPLPATIGEYKVQRGTSFSAPQLAARFAQVLAGVREKLGDQRATGALWIGKASGAGALGDGVLTADEIRAALSASARYFQPTDFNAACVAEMSQSFLAITSPPSPLRPASATPWLDMGWGYVGADETALATRVILGSASAPDKPADATAWMSQFMNARAAAFPGPQLP